MWVVNLTVSCTMSQIEVTLRFLRKEDQDALPRFAKRHYYSVECKKPDHNVLSRCDYAIIIKE